MQSPHSALVQFMYKLRLEDFRSEKNVNKLISYLEQSPLNKQPLPDAGSKIGGYYRRLHCKFQENVNSFLIREDKTHDNMLRALQRLLREKELDFQGCDIDREELRRFCGFAPGMSVDFGDDPKTADEDPNPPCDRGEQSDPTEIPRGSRPGRPFTDSKGSGRGGPRSSHSTASNETVEPRRGKDLLQRLMEKGLMPLTALDIIRGWLFREIYVANE